MFFGTTASGVTSLYSLIAVSIEQYLAVVHPLSLQTRRGTPLRQSLGRATVTVVTAILVSIPSEAICSWRGTNTGNATHCSKTWHQVGYTRGVGHAVYTVIDCFDASFDTVILPVPPCMTIAYAHASTSIV